VRGHAAATGPAAWHDVECASYAADLPIWRELADRHGGPVLDVGAGTGRVALDLAAHGHAVTALDADPELVRACARRARERELSVRAVAADARSFDLGTSHPLALLAMQVAQLLGGERGRLAMLAAVARHLAPGGELAIALADPYDTVAPEDALPPLPDVLELDGWLLSSTPLSARDEGDCVAIDRHRQAVSPAGELTEAAVTVRLEWVTPAQLEKEATKVGLRALEPWRVPATRDYVGSSVVRLEAPR
jgi:SAM-dependent methyltransferase